MLMSSLRDIFTRLQQNSVRDVLLVSVRYVGAHPGGHQHVVSIRIPIKLGKTFFQKSLLRNIPLTRVLARVFVYLHSFISQILDFLHRTVFIFILIYFEQRDTENLQQPGLKSFQLQNSRYWSRSYFSKGIVLISLHFKRRKKGGALSVNTQISAAALFRERRLLNYFR